MSAIPFPTSSNPGNKGEGGGRLINAMAEKLPDGRIRRYRVPGLRELVDVLSHENFRGGIYVNTTLLAAFTDRLYAIASNGDGTYTATNLGALNGSDRVYFARNNKLPTPDIVAVTDSTAYECTIGGAPTAYSDADVGSPNAVSFNKGYFVFTYGDGRMRASGLNDVTINTLDTAFAESKPDGLLFPAPIGSYLLGVGEQTTEIWRVDANNVNGFPFSFLDTIPIGALSQNCIAGFEDGLTNNIIMVGHDGIPVRFENYAPKRIPHPPVVKAIERLTDKTTLAATTYVHEGHPIYALSCAEWTWCYDLSTEEWFERASYESDRWRATVAVKAFGVWVTGEEATGKLYAVDPDYKREGADPLRYRVASATATGFPYRMALPGIQIDMVAGVGSAAGSDPIETDPVAQIDWSLDGGVTWSNPVLRSLGKQGEYSEPMRVMRLGLASVHGVQIRVTVDDPVDAVLFSGDFLKPEQRRS